MDSRPSYFAIIPANVRYDQDLKANAKLLYGEITALCNEKGYCWATNDYFAKLYSVSNTSISTWISDLRKKCYINVQMEYKEGSKEILNRYISLIVHPIKENLNTPIKENLKDNSTSSFNNTINNIDTSKIENLPLEAKKAKKEIKNKEIPTLKEFGEYALSKQSDFDFPIDKKKVKLKYDAWVENDWMDGNDKKITNWKVKLINTLPYCLSDKKIQTEAAPMRSKLLTP